MDYGCGRSALIAISFIGLHALGIACSAETSPDSVVRGGDSGVDGSTTGDTGVVTDTGRPDTADAAPPIPAFVSNPPGAKYVNTEPSAAPGLILVSSNFIERASGGQYFQEWFGELRNTGPTTYCYPRVYVSLTDGSVEKATFSPFADAAPYVIGGSTSTSSAPCLAPGARAGLHTNNLVSVPADPSSIKSVEVAFAYLEPSGAVAPDPSAPGIESVKVNSSTYGYTVTGTLRARATINNIGVDVYPVLFGYVYDNLPDTNLGEIVKGATWDFEAAYADRSFTDYMVFVGYIRGSATAFAPPSSSAGEFGAMEAAFQAERFLRRERLALHAKRMGANQP